MYVVLAELNGTTAQARGTHRHGRDGAYSLLNLLSVSEMIGAETMAPDQRFCRGR
jgi:hypothetical protein